MSDLLDMFQFFHFLRPWWLALIPVVLVIWWQTRVRATARPDPPRGLAPHLAEALTVQRDRGFKLLAVDGVAAAMLLVTLAVAGPTWSRVPNPLVAQTAPLAVVLAVSDSMNGIDVPPSRLERAKHKILDLIARRAGARTALVAYAGSAHRVVPLTEDPEVLKPLLEGLSPEVMPEEGNNATAALQVAREALAGEEIPGAILFALDELNRADLAAFQQHREQHQERIVFLTLGGSESALADLESVPGAAVVPLTPDDADVREIDHRVAAAFREALAQDDRQQWDDRGWVLAWGAALLTLLWFRRGWTMFASLLLVSLVSCAPAEPPAGDRLADWFFTPDQQGRLAFDELRFADAAARFQDPWWQGFALYRAGQYPEAAQVYARLETADAAFAQGVAHVKGREYGPGIAAFEKALERDPEHAAAARNLEIARAILVYVEGAREAADTGTGSEGADEVVFDKEAEGGFEMQVDQKTQVKIQTAEQWMRTVDTRTADFLRSRFALEAAGADE